MPLFDNFSKKISKTSQEAVKKTKELAEIAKKNSEIINEKGKIKNLYYELGERYFNLFGENPPTDLEEICDNIRDSIKNIEMLTEEIQKIKGIKVCPNCKEEVSDSTMFCGHCGFNMSENNTNTEEVQAQAIECPNCGAKLDEDSKFCTECGTKL